ncbi:MAG: CHAT domain-containing protein [Bacteroidales bacterium]|nr:CHAT domain-containing protein [Bacteroidales bacterium]
MRRLFCLIFIIAFGGIIAASCQDPAVTARRLYLAYDSAWVKGDFNKSELYLNRILDGGYQLPGLNMAIVHNALGLVCYETGRIKEALQYYRDAEALSSGTGPGPVSMRIRIYNNIALLHNWLGDYTNALEHYNKAIRLLDSVPSRDEAYFSQLSRLQFNKGVVYFKLGRPEEALDILKESERIKEVHGHEYLGSVYFNLARVYQLLGEPGLSREYYNKSIDHWTAEYDAGYYQLANVYLHFGQYLVDRGEVEQGLSCFQEALQNYTANYGIKHPLTSGCYEQMAGYYLDRGDFRQALELVQLALISVSGDFNDKNIFTNPAGESSFHDLTLLKGYATKSKALEGLAKKEESEDRKLEILTAALETNSRSIDVLHRLQGSYLSRESRIYLTSGQKELFSTGIRLNLQLFELFGQELYREQAFLMAARGKSNELLFEMKSKESLYLESLPDTLALSISELKQQIDQYSNLIQVENMEVQPDSGKLAAWKEQLFYTRDSFNRQMEHLFLEHPQIGQFKSLDIDFSMERIRQNLRRKETLVEYFISNPDRTGSKKLFVFVVTEKECHVHQDQIDSAFHRELDIVLGNLHEFNPYRETPLRYDSLKTALFGIYQQFVEPVESLFRGEKLVIVPDEELAYLPFGALIDRYEPETILNYAGLSYLMNQYDITYMYNSQLIKKEKRRQLQFPRIMAWVPEYATSTEASIRNLEGFSEEVREILEIVKGRSIRNPDKGEAERLLEEDAVIHLAMHALAGEKAGGSPYFILDAEKDSFLTNRLHDYEINALTLSSPMVVLSSCRSGGGQLQGGEGIMSLSRSFLMAGAQSVVHTLWPVEDARGSELMVEYYRELKRGKSKSSALTRAKQQYLADTPLSYTHPYYWAAYQITGNPAPLSGKWKFVFFPVLILVISLSLYYLIRRSFLSRD